MGEILRRSVPTTLERVDEHTLTARIMPWNVTAKAADERPDGTFDIYPEAFADTAFNRQLRAAERQDGVYQRVSLIDDHRGSKLGFATLLHRESDGLYGTMRLLPSRVEDVETLMGSGIDKISVEFLPLRGGTRNLADGTRLRTDAHLVRVALVPDGAYPGAEVLAMRDAEDASAAADREYQEQVAELDQFLAEAIETQARWNERIGT